MNRTLSMKYMLFTAALTMTLIARLAAPASAAPSVVVSIKPLHSLVSGVMKGVGEPYLLIKGAASPHTFSLKPSDARELERARVVFWVGELLAPSLERPLEVLPKRAEVVAMAEIKGLKLLKLREGGLWEGHDDHHDEHGHGKAMTTTTTNMGTARPKTTTTTIINTPRPKTTTTMITNTPRGKTITTMITNTRKPKTIITTSIITAVSTRTPGSTPSTPRSGCMRSRMSSKRWILRTGKNTRRTKRGLWLDWTR